MSRKVFTAGEVLAAADVNSFLMDQTVMSFAGTAARGSAIPSPVEGMTTYLEDSNSIEIHNGTSFAPALSIGAWTAFTPTWNSGLTVGNGVYNIAHYALVGKTVHVAVDFSLGSTSAVTGDLQLDVPAAIARKSAFYSGVFSSFFFDTGVGNYASIVLPSSTSSARFLLRFLGVTGSIVGASSASATAPFTWGNTDRIAFGGTWEIA